jgi:hypothetical protein
MASNGGDRSGLLTAGGVLSIVAGALELVGVVIMLALTVGVRILLGLARLPFHPGGWPEHVLPLGSFWVLVLGVPLLVLGIIAITGGVSAIRRKNFGLSLAGAICAFPSNILGILAIIFVSLSKREFEGKE